MFRQSSNHTLFREIPPLDLVKSIIGMLSIPTDFPVTFQKKDINLSQSPEAAYLLEPYYKPCKAKRYLDTTDNTRWITVIRHILQPHGWKISYQETTRDKKKAIFYTIQPVDDVLLNPVELDFS
jgi:hypothetical protein